jgi:hypothetical protein
MPASTTRSGNPAKRAAVKKAPADRKQPLVVSSVSDWGNDEGELLELPSNKVVRIERVALTSLLAENLLGDSISAMAVRAVEAGQGMSQDEIRSLGEDPAKVMEAMDAFDKIAARCIIEPICQYYKVTEELVSEYPEMFTMSDVGKVIPKDKRVSGVLYSDKIDINDKVFLFQVISGGTTDLQRFRDELGESLAGLSAG